MDYFKTYREMISLRGLTDHTVKSYSTYIRSYLEYLQTILLKQPENVSWDDLRDYIRWLQKERSLSDRTINACISQLRSLPCMCCTNPGIPPAPMRKFDSYLPFVPTQKEADIFISTLSDLKPKAMVSLMYSAGLRVGEVCNLRYCDIERKNMRIHIAHSKSRSDRYAILSQKALDLLTRYWFEYGRPTEWLFPKQTDSSRPIDTFYICRHMRAHEDFLGWKHRITCHSFRHAFGTHFMKRGRPADHQKSHGTQVPEFYPDLHSSCLVPGQKYLLAF